MVKIYDNNNNDGANMRDGGYEKRNEIKSFSLFQ